MIPVGFLLSTGVIVIIFGLSEFSDAWKEYSARSLDFNLIMFLVIKN